METSHSKDHLHSFCRAGINQSVSSEELLPFDVSTPTKSELGEIIELELSRFATPFNPNVFDSSKSCSDQCLAAEEIIEGDRPKTPTAALKSLISEEEKNSNPQPCSPRQAQLETSFVPLVPDLDISSACGSVSTLLSDDEDPYYILKNLKEKNSERPIIAHLNINSISSKFEPLTSMIKDNIDFLLVTESKLDDTFPHGQFQIEGYARPIRLDRTRNGGGLIIFVRDDHTTLVPQHDLVCCNQWTGGGGGCTLNIRLRKKRIPKKNFEQGTRIDKFFRISREILLAYNFAKLEG